VDAGSAIAEPALNATESPTGVPTFDPSLAASVVWSSEALEILDRAEASAREGDWQGFGEALDELRGLLERLRPAGG
jgi:hypothetical protein